jgi:hypothetical protein
LHNKWLIPWWSKHTGLGVGHPKDPIGGLKGDSLGGSPPSELPLSESLSCHPFSGWWIEPLSTKVGKLVVTCTMVGINVVTCCQTSCLSFLITSWTTIGNWFPIEFGIYVGGTTCCSGTRYTFPST